MYKIKIIFIVKSLPPRDFLNEILYHTVKIEVKDGRIFTGIFHVYFNY